MTASPPPETPATMKGQRRGLATLDSDGKLRPEQVPDDLAAAAAQVTADVVRTVVGEWMQANPPAAGPQGEPGSAGPAGASVTVDQIRSAVEAHLVANPPPAGPVGSLGPVGPQGEPGPAGERGPTGVGVAGPTGPIGSAGPAGERGEVGPVGPAGPVGAVGPQGPRGDRGDIGPAGPAGPVGETGPAGQRGEPGVAGPKGDVGPAGQTGPAGVKGDTGAAGAKGDMGSQGPKGDTGATGATGTPADMTRVVAAENAISALQADRLIGTSGEATVSITLGLGLTRDVSVNFKRAMPDNNYAALAEIDGASTLLGNLQVQYPIKVKTTTGCTVNVKAVGVLSAQTTTIRVMAFKL